MYELVWLMRVAAGGWSDGWMDDDNKEADIDFV